MTRILSYNGTQDAIRFGQISFGQRAIRSYQFDRLNGSVKLFHGNGYSTFSKPDTDPDHIARALAVLRDREPGEGAWLECCRDDERRAG